MLIFTANTINTPTLCNLRAKHAYTTKTKELKGISIVLVMLFHLVTIHKTTLPYELRWVASFGVSVFLLVSGYGLFLSEKEMA